MLSHYHEEVARYAADHTIELYPTFNNATGWPASVRSTIAALTSSSRRFGHSSSSNYAPAPSAYLASMGPLAQERTPPSILPQSSLNGGDPQTQFTRWLQSVPSNLWGRIVSGAVKDVTRNVTVFHDCRFARSRRGSSVTTSASGRQYPQAYGQANSLVMVPVDIDMTKFEGFADSDGSEEEHYHHDSDSLSCVLLEDSDANDVTRANDNSYAGDTSSSLALDASSVDNASDMDSTSDADDTGDADDTSYADDPGDVNDAKGSPSTREGGDHASWGKPDQPIPVEHVDAGESVFDCLDFDRTTENTLPYKIYDSLSSDYVHLHLCASPFHPTPLVPILCIADQHNIVALMVSALSQRKALGLDMPVLGILHPTSGSIVSVLVAWRDDSTFAPGICLLLSSEGDSPSDGVFDLAHPPSLYSLLEFLQFATTQAVAELEQSVSQGAVSSICESGGWRCDSTDMHSLRASWLTDIGRWSRHVYDSIVSSGLWDMSEISDDVDSMWSAAEVAPWIPEQELYEVETSLIDLKHPGIAAWSFDHHVLTVGLNRGGVVHAVFASVLDDVYDCICSQKVDGPVGLAAPIIGDMVERMFHLAQDNVTASQDGRLVWRAFMSWIFGNEAPHDCGPDLFASTVIDTLRCLEYDDVVRSLPKRRMPHVGFMQSVKSHNLLTVRDWRQFVMAHEDSSKWLPEDCRLGSLELQSTWRHMERAYDTIKNVFKVSATNPRAAAVQIDQLGGRLTRYPLGCRLDAAICVTDLTLVDQAASETGIWDFLQEISFLRDDTSDGHADFHFNLPLLLVKHQASDSELNVVTRNVLRLSCVSAAHFLAVLGIGDFPVYGLATAGRYGYVSAAWRSSTDGILYIADRNSAHYRFDLSTKEGVIRVIGFLSGLQEHATELVARFASVRGEVLERIRTDKGRRALRWSLRFQIDEYGLWPAISSDSVIPGRHAQT